MVTCDPLKHYLVDLTDKVHKIKELVDDGKYFSISKARRYGKTTTLSALKKALSKDSTVLSVSFEGLGTECFETGRAFVRTFLGSMFDTMFDEAKDNPLDVPHEISTQLEKLSADEADTWALYDLMTVLRRWCRASARPLVLIIDCIDTATDSQAFRDFLSMLGADFNRRTARHGPALHSVIFSGVEDVRFLPPIAGREDNYIENSPFNITSDFPIDMSLSEQGIKGMLDDYEADHETGMDTKAVAKAIREWTNGYPFLVSRICQLLDERAQKETDVAGAWTTRAWTRPSGSSSQKTIPSCRP